MFFWCSLLQLKKKTLESFKKTWGMKKCLSNELHRKKNNPRNFWKQVNEINFLSPPSPIHLLHFGWINRSQMFRHSTQTCILLWNRKGMKNIQVHLDTFHIIKNTKTLFDHILLMYTVAVHIYNGHSWRILYYFFFKAIVQ